MSRPLLLFACLALVASQQVFDLSSAPNVQCRPDEAIILTIASNGTTGRLWELQPFAGAPFEVVGDPKGIYLPGSSGAIGAPGRQQFTIHCFSAAQPRTVSDFVLSRSTPDGTSLEQMLVLLSVVDAN